MRSLNIVLYVTGYEDLRTQVADMLRQRNAVPKKVVFDGVPSFKWKRYVRDTGVLVETLDRSVVLDVEYL